MGEPVDSVPFYEEFDARLQFPFSAICSGPSLSGKTTFITSLLDRTEDLISERIDSVVWFYGVKTPALSTLEAKYHRDWFTCQPGLPDTENLEQYVERGKRGLFVLDDLADAVSNSPFITTLLNNYVHHKNISVILVLQDLFCPGKYRASFLKSVHYLVLFKNPLNNTASKIIAQRFMPSNIKAFTDIYNEVFKAPYSYLLIDGHQKTSNYLRLKTDIFNIGQTVYIPKSKK